MFQSLKQLHIDLFSICYSYEIGKDPLNQPLTNASLVFSAVTTILITFIVMLTEIIFKLNKDIIPILLKFFTIPHYFLFSIFNYYYFDKLSKNKKLKVLNFDEIRMKYNIFCGIGILTVILTAFLAHINYLQNN